jgi:membrane-bound lytic murein transglycosylase B
MTGERSMAWNGQSNNRRTSLLRWGLALAFAVALMPDTGTANDAVDGAEPLNSLRTRLVDDGIDPIIVNKYFEDSRFELIPKLLRVNIRQPSGTAGYQRFLGDASVRTAAAYLELHREEIEAVLGDSPVSPEVVVAILNVESSLGTYKGTYPLMNVFASLSLLSTDPITEVAPDFWSNVLDGIPETQHPSARNKARKRAHSKARWAYRELRTILLMADDSRFDPLGVKGSWAGAYGLPQFIPTSAKAYGRDGNGDGIVDLNDLSDAVASVGHYLRVHGYREDNPAKRRKAVWHYNHSDEYVDCIITLADKIHAHNAENDTP